MDAIRNDKPNEVSTASKPASSLGWKVIRAWNHLRRHANCPDEYAPNVDKLTMDSPAPLPADADGKYPIPQPGLITNREY